MVFISDCSSVVTAVTSDCSYTIYTVLSYSLMWAVSFWLVVKHAVGIVKCMGPLGSQLLPAGVEQFKYWPESHYRSCLLRWLSPLCLICALFHTLGLLVMCR